MAPHDPLCCVQPWPHLCIDDLHVAYPERRARIALLLLELALQLDGPCVAQGRFRREDGKVDVTVWQVGLQRHAAERAGRDLCMVRSLWRLVGL